MDDGIAEGPHARAKRIYDHSRVASWPWVSSTMRLADNIHDLRVKAPMHNVDVERLWRSWKSLLQMGSGRASRRNKKVSKPVFRGIVYRMTLLDGSSGEPSPMAIADGSAEAWSDDEVVGDDGGEERPQNEVLPDGPRTAQASEEVRMLRQLFAASFAVGDFLSMPLQTEEGNLAAFVCEVLEKDTRSKLVKTYKSEDDLPELYMISVQPLEQWRPLSADPARLGDELECFVFLEPCKMDLVRLMGVDLSVRQRIFKWSSKPSDIEGCFTLYAPEPLRPRMSLGDAGLPALCLLDALTAAGWSSVERVVVIGPMRWCMTVGMPPGGGHIYNVSWLLAICSARGSPGSAAITLWPSTC